MNNKDIAYEWLKMAELDYESAIFLLDMIPKPLEIICYHCQQSAEKYLKSFIAYCGSDIIKTHDLVVLNKKCIEFEDSFKIIEKFCIELTDYGVQVRYPFHFDIEERDVENAIIHAGEIRKFIKTIINDFNEKG